MIRPNGQNGIPGMVIKQGGGAGLQYIVLKVMLICLALSLAGCGADKKAVEGETIKWDQEEEAAYQKEDADFMQADKSEGNPYTADTELSEVIREPLFGDYGRLILPVDSGYYSGDTLETLRLTWYSNIDPEKTVEIANYMKDHIATQKGMGNASRRMICRKFTHCLIRRK